MRLKQRMFSAVTALTVLMASQAGSLSAFAANSDKYISEVFVAYGKTEEDARKWLTDHGWEPVGKDLNAGKLSYWDSSAGHHDEVAAVMGIKRTNDPNDAVTDMAVMNMNGGYSFKDYQMLVQEKQTEINAFVDSFIPVLREYRDNYNGKGSAAGKARADLAHELLNKFYDGEPDGEYAVNDTGKPLGDLLLNETSRELGSKYDSMSKDEKSSHADITQILLESSGPAVLAIEQTLAMAADTSEDTWLDRLSEMSGVDLAENIEYLVPSAAGKDLSPSAAESLLKSTYGDAAEAMAAGYDTVQQELLWYEAYMENNDLVLHEGESDDDFSARINAHFEALKTKDEALYDNTLNQYLDAGTMYDLLYSIPYEGEWGETLGDFFNPEDGTDYGADADNFLPFAAVLSEGQFAGMEFLSLYSLLRIGAGTEEAAKETLPDVQEIFKDAESISIYSGINRAIFRGGVALTSQAKMQENMGRSSWFDNALDAGSFLNIAVYVTLGIGFMGILAGSRYIYATSYNNAITNAKITDVKAKITLYKQSLGHDRDRIQLIKNGNQDPKWKKFNLPTEEKELSSDLEKLEKYEKEYQDLKTELESDALGRWALGIGGALMLAAAAFEIYQMYKFYQRDFTAIPMMIVDEADIVTYLTDENGKPVLDEKGNQKKNIEFDQFAYYDVVRCNRQDVGKIGDWQDGVDQYAEWGCGNAADLNCDCGKQWLALYTNKSPAKGDPILADSLTYQTGSNKMPKDCTRGLHFFTYDYAMDIADEAYAFNNKEGGIYLFWKSDEKAFATASVFTTGHLALTGIGGLMAGMLGATAVMMLKGKRKNKESEAPAAA